ncbi:MAG: hypothetical protein H7145_05475 [Akkermansiaceae bacterium]|nr:hypothetical protein [Armatimonadota bacterium]
MGKRVFAEEGIKLEASAERFAKLLLRRFPRWRRYATYEQEGEPDDPTYYLKVEVPSHNPTLTAPLIIYILPFWVDIIAEMVVFLYKISGSEPVKFITWCAIPSLSDSVRRLQAGATTGDDATFMEYS